MHCATERDRLHRPSGAHSREILGWNSIAVNNPSNGATFVTIVHESGSLLATVGPALAAFPDLVGADDGK